MTVEPEALDAIILILIAIAVVCAAHALRPY